MKFSRIAVLAAISGLCLAGSARAEGWWSGDWYLKLGGAGFSAPKYEGAGKRELQFSPIISLGKVGPEARFTSRNDNASFSLFDQGAVRAGITGKLIMKRDEKTSPDLKGLDPVKLGGEAGAFAEAYPLDWMRVRAEVRHGIRSHSGVVADVAADAFIDLTPELRLSGGPRAAVVSKGYNKAFYGVSAAESAASGLSRYEPGGGLHSYGAGAALTWQATEKLELATFAEYKRLAGSAADSSLVQERGSRNQFMVGVSASYKFGFSLP